MKGETCVKAVPGFNCRTVPPVSDFTHAQFTAVKGSLLQMPYGHSSEQLVQLDLITLGITRKTRGEGSVTKPVGYQAQVEVFTHTYFENFSLNEWCEWKT